MYKYYGKKKEKFLNANKTFNFADGQAIKLRRF